MELGSWWADQLRMKHHETILISPDPTRSELGTGWAERRVGLSPWSSRVEYSTVIEGRSPPLWLHIPLSKMTPPLPTPVFTNQNPSFRPVSTSSQFSSPQPTRSTAWPLIPDSDEPASPLYPLSHRPGQQALFTTYPSRLRLGTTSLVQPIFTNTYIQQRIDRAHSPHDTLPSSNSSLLHSSAKHVSNFPHLTHPSNGSVSDLGRRTRKVVNYSENDNRFPEFELDSGIDDDQRGRSTARNRTGTLPASSAAKGSGSLVPPNSSEEDRRRENEALAKRKYADGKIYLGEEPPAKYIKVQRRIRKPTGIMTNLVLGELNEPVLEDQDTLVPIRIEFETEDLRIRDVFTWNLRGVCHFLYSIHAWKRAIGSHQYCDWIVSTFLTRASHITRSFCHWILSRYRYLTLCLRV